MGDTRMEAARGGEGKITRATGKTLAGVRSAAAGTAGEVDAAGFPAVLATLGLPGDGDMPALPLPAVDDSQFQPLLQGGEPVAAAGLLPMESHMPWMSLIGQTAQLDGKGDADLRHGVAGDFLSGRGSTGLLAQRRELTQALTAGAHAAFMAPAQGGAEGKAGPAVAGADLPANAAVQAAVDGAASNDAARPGGLQDALMAAQLQDERPADARGTAQALVARAEHGLQRMHTGVALHGMTAVPPQELAQLREWLKPARAGSSEADAARTSTVEGMSAGHGIAAAMGAAHAGAQGGSQDASAFAQARADVPGAAPSEREQEISQQVAFWVHQTSQNAALTVEHEGAPIKVQVQLQGQEAHVRFAAGDAQARDWLGSGEPQLRELLQAQGLQLAGVSISAGEADDPAQSGSQPQDRSMARMGRVQVIPDGLAAADAGRLRPAGGRASGVDLFV
jgi:flagellar hook-length control protein FliK